MKKKLLFCSYDLNIGGIETALINLLDNMDYDKYDIDLILEKKEGLLLDRLNKNVNVIEYRVSNSKNVVVRKFKNLFKKLFWILKNYHKYDFSCCYATYSLPCNMLAYYGSLNNSLYIHSNYKNIYDESGLRNFFDARRIDKFKNIVFVANEARNDMISFYPFLENNSMVINNLINYDDILKLSKENIDFKKKEKFLFVFVGRLEECSKRLTKLISVVKDINSVELIVVGDGPDRDLYENLISDCDRIHMVGAKKNPYPYMRIADYIVLSSDYEGFPVVYSEAIVLGKKIISTIDVSDDFISIPNRFGYIVSKNQEEMHDEIVDILKKDNLKYDKVDFCEVNFCKIKKVEKLIDQK
jgi:glycosyltransferase involved in cell wall biosynthesis